MTVRGFFQTKWKVCSWRHIVINLLSNEIGDSALALSEWGISISGLFQGQNLVQNIQVLAARKRRNVRKFLLLNHKIQIFYFLKHLFSYEKYVRNVLLFFSEKRYVLVYREMETLVESNGNFHDDVTDNVELTDSAIGKYFILLFIYRRLNRWKLMSL
jgi:hypothetical protein